MFPRLLYLVTKVTVSVTKVTVSVTKVTGDSGNIGPIFGGVHSRNVCILVSDVNSRLR